MFLRVPIYIIPRTKDFMCSINQCYTFKLKFMRFWSAEFSRELELWSLRLSTWLQYRDFFASFIAQSEEKKALASVLFPSDKAVVVMQTRCHGNQNKNNITIQTMYERQTFCLFYTDGNISNSFRTTGCKEMGRKNGSKFNGSI